MEELNKLDQIFNEGLKNAQIAPPLGVWEGIASTAASSAAAGSGVGSIWLVIAKWVGSSLAVGAISYGIYTISNNNNHQVANNLKVEKTELTEKVEQNSIQNQDAGVKNSNTHGLTDINGSVKIQNQTSPSGNNKNAPNINLDPISVLPKNNPISGNVQDDQIKSRPNTDGKAGSTAVKPLTPAGTNCPHTLSIKATKISPTSYSFEALNAQGDVSWTTGPNYDNLQQGLFTSYEFPSNIYGEIRVKASSLNERNCHDSAFSYVKLIPADPKIPNVFTPGDGDSYNNEYVIDITTPQFFDLTVYDKLHNVVFHSSNPETHWKGFCGSRECPGGLYPAVLIYQFKGEIAKHTKNVNIRLIRDDK